MQGQSVNKTKRAVDIALGKMALADENDALHPPVDELTRRRTVDAVLERRRAEFYRVKFEWRPRYVGVAAAILVAVSVLFWGMSERGDEPLQPAAVLTSSAVVAPPPSVEPAPSESMYEQVPSSRFSLLHGEVLFDDARVSLGAGGQRASGAASGARIAAGRCSLAVDVSQHLGTQGADRR